MENHPEVTTKGVHTLAYTSHLFESKHDVCPLDVPGDNEVGSLKKRCQLDL